MTIEGRPNIQHDWNEEYARQRKDRLQDAVDDYLQDNKVSPLTFYNDLRDCLEDIVTYHETSKNRAQGALELIMGHRPVDLDSDAKTANVYEYAAHITMDDINRFQKGNSL